MKDKNIQSLEELNNQVLAPIYSTGQFFQGFMPTVLYTFGVKTFAEEAQAYWFINDLCTVWHAELKNLERDKYYLNLNVTDGEYQVTVEDYRNNIVFTTQRHFTDLVDGNLNFYINFTGNGNQMVICLPNED